MDDITPLPKAGPSLNTSRFLIGKADVFFILLITDFWFGVIFYGLIEKQIGFTYTDEICALGLLMMFFYYRVFLQKSFRVPSAIVAGVLFTYCAYSFSINSNVPVAIFSDMFVVAKPFISAFVAWELRPHFTPKAYSILRMSTFAASGYILFVGLIGGNAMFSLFGHPSQLAGAAVATSLLYLSSVRLSKRAVVIHSLMFSLSLLSLRAKAFGVFFLNATILWILYNSIIRKSFRIRRRHLIGIFPIIIGTAYVAKEKITVYFIQGLSDLGNIHEARSALYFNSIRIAQDFFPFGSGFASYGSWFSGVYYSKLYYRYGMSTLWGLTPDWFDFVSDTFYPQVLSQFGVVGLVLLLICAFLVLRSSYLAYMRCGKPVSKAKNLYIVFFILVYFLIESFADSTFVGNRGQFMMLLLGLSISNLSHNDQSQNESVG